MFEGSPLNSKNFFDKLFLYIFFLSAFGRLSNYKFDFFEKMKKESGVNFIFQRNIYCLSLPWLFQWSIPKDNTTSSKRA
jgi:hypothetical protein